MPLLGALLAVFCAVVLPMTGCSGARESERERAEEREREREERMRERAGEGREHEGEWEEEEEEYENAPPPKPMAWGAGMTAEQIEGRSDTVRFHIGSPLFLRLKIAGPRGCAPFDGQPFFFDALGAQLGWGFEEVSDSLIFPREAGSCDRVVMLSSENSNRIAEGSYTFKSLVFLDADTRIYSDTIAVEAVRSSRGADTLSYARFLQELIVRKSALLNDPETIRALFADGTPRSAESEVYRAAILLRANDPAAAHDALASAATLADRRHKPLDPAAAAAHKAIAKAVAARLNRK